MTWHRRKHKNAYNGWTNAEMAELLYLKNKGKNDKEISVILGRSINAIIKRLEYINSYKLNDLNKSIVRGIVKKLKAKNTALTVKNNKELYAIGSMTSAGVCLQKEVYTEEEVLAKLIYKNNEQVLYKLVEVKVEQRLVVK